MKLLILQHVPHEHPGYIVQYAREKNIILDIIELWKPYGIPDVSGYSGVIILGGPMSVYEDFSSKHDELALIQRNLGSIPILGICEVLIGLGLLIKRLIPYTIPLLLMHMAATFFPVFILKTICFDAFPYCPTLAGQYIIKNLILISGALVVAGKYNEKCDIW